jgi:adenosylcobinamide-phosphate synthase
VERRPVLGDGRSPEVPDIGRAVHLSRDVTVALAGALAAVDLASRATRRRR